MARAIPCPCGRCKYWLVDPQAAIQGVSFTEREARAVAKFLDRLDAPGRPGFRVVLDMTGREAEIVRTALKDHFKRKKKEWDPDFVPEPGRHDVNKMRMSVDAKFIREINEQLGTPNDPTYDLPFEEQA